MTRFAILVEGQFNFLYAKTCNAMLRYKPDEVVCCIDSTNAGSTTNDIMQIGGNIPVVPNIASALQYKPDTLLIGIATEGGYLPDNMRTEIFTAIENGLNIVCGLHEFLSNDTVLSELAKKHNVTITDLRKPPDVLPFTKGSWKNRTTPVLLTVGTDCDTGKMTAAWEIKNKLKAHNIKASFVGTGQTGILLSESGVAVDAVVSDFVAGAIEAEIDKVADSCDVVIVEGQGSLTHMAYSGVTLGLLHGSMPDMIVMCHEPSRKKDTFNHPMQPVNKVLKLYLDLMTIFKPCVCAGLCLITYSESDETAQKTVHSYNKDYGLPADDFVRFGGETIIDNIIGYLNKGWF